jgi:hypothetical protein
MKELRPELSEVLNIVTKYVNYIKMRPLKSRLFAQICEEMGTQYKSFHVLLQFSLAVKRKCSGLCLQ